MCFYFLNQMCLGLPQEKSKEIITGHLNIFALLCPEQNKCALYKHFDSFSN